MTVAIRRVTTAEASPDELAQARHLMDLAFDGDFTDHDWRHALGGTHIVADDAGTVVAHAAVVPRTITAGERGWSTGYVEAVATAPDRQGQGFGSLVMGEVAGVLHQAFELGALSTEGPAFYERLGWERWRGPTFVRDGEALRRTPDEDGGVLVLRYGPSAGVDLAAPIACEARPGDDW